MRHGPSEEDLMVGLLHPLLVDKFELRNDCADLQFAFTVEIRNVSDNQVIAVEGNCVPPLDQTPEVVIMIYQLVKQ